MNDEKHDYKKGLLWFVIVALLIISLFPVPDGDILLYKFLALFGISHEIPIGPNGTLYIYPLVIFILIIVSFKKVMKYWHSYGVRFRAVGKVLYALPFFIIAAVFILNLNLQNIFYNIKSMQGGLKSVAYYQLADNKSDLFKYNTKSGYVTYHYDFIFENYGREPAQFQIMVTNDYEHHFVPSEIYIRNSDSSIKTVTLYPNERARIQGEFTAVDNTQSHASGCFIPSPILVSSTEQFSPKPIGKLPNN